MILKISNGLFYMFKTRHFSSSLSRNINEFQEVSQKRKFDFETRTCKSHFSYKSKSLKEYIERNYTFRFTITIQFTWPRINTDPKWPKCQAPYPLCWLMGWEPTTTNVGKAIELLANNRNVSRSAIMVNIFTLTLCSPIRRLMNLPQLGVWW